MSRLLVIEPNTMLRYGLAMALTPDHALTFVDSLPASPSLSDVDAVIVDAAMLRLGNTLTASSFKGVGDGEVPTVWIDDMELSSPPVHGSFVILNTPVQREQLYGALFACLKPSAGLTSAAGKFEPGAAKPAKSRGKKAMEPTAALAHSENVIELVEVVDDEPENG